MAVTPPTRGQQDWDDEMNNALQSLDAAAQSAAANASTAVSTANSARDIAQSVHTAVIGTADAATAGFINDPASETATALSATFEAGTQRIIYVSPTGNDARNGKTMSAAKATIAAALTAMGSDPGVIVLDNGTHPVGSTLAWPATAKCGLSGQGPGNTILLASGQSGPVLDLSGVGYNLNRAVFGGFTLQGDGTAGTAKKGLALSTSVSIAGAFFHDIAVNSTGGAPFALGKANLCHFDRLSADVPVSAEANDVPYLVTSGPFNGNSISRLMLRANVAEGVATVGPSGAVVLTDDGTYAPHSNVFEAPQVQGLRLPTNGTIFALSGNRNVIANMQAFDEGKVAGTTGTSYVRLTAPSVSDLGGNQIVGVIPGRQTTGASIDTGVDVRQSRNRIEGVKGYRGYNVTLATGVTNTYVHLAGAVSAASDPGVVDNSGTTGNAFFDGYLGTEGPSQYRRDARSAANGSAGPRFYDPATPANGGVWLGQSGVRLSGVDTAAHMTAETMFYRNVAGTAPPRLYIGPNTAWPGIFSGSGSPEGVVTARSGSLYLRYDGGAGTTLYVKESGTGTTGWVAK